MLTTLETLPRFTKPDAHGDHCWHAVRVVHRLRLMRARDASVERLGSHLHAIFQGNRGQPHRDVARLFIREAGLGGEQTSAQDNIVHEMSRFMLTELSKRPFTRRGSKRKREQRAGDCDAAVVRAGLRRAPILGPAPQEQLPSKLKSDVEQQLREQAAVATRLSVGRLPSLPLFAMDHRHMEQQRRDVGGNLYRQDLQEWLESAVGKQWRETRATLFQ